MLRHPLRASIGIITIAALGSACSSDAPKTKSTTTTVATTTTVTTQATSSTSVTAFFEHEGAPLLAFERATKELATGSRPERATCIHLRDDVLPKISKSPDTLILLAQRVPDKSIASAFNTVVSLKLLVVLGCATGAPPTGAQDPKGYTSIRDFARGLKVLLAPYGISV